VTDIHAFDSDGTASPGAQIALDAATDGFATQADIAAATADLASLEDVGEAVQGLASTTELAAAIDAIPDADAGQRGMMSAQAAQDLSRVAVAPLSRRVLQAALAGQRSAGVGVIFAGSSTIQGDKATSTDRRPVQRVSGYLTPRPAQTAVSGSTPSDGVQVWAWGIGGSTSANYLTSSHYTAVGSIKPVLMVHVVGSNDWSGSRTPAQYEASMRDHLDALRAASPDTVHLLIGQHQRNSPATGSHPWEDYTAVLRTLAEEDPDRVEFLDLWPRYAAIGIPGADPWGWLHSDGIHLTDQSYRVLADWLAEHLGIPTPTGAAELYVGTLTGGDGKTDGDVVLAVTIPARPYPRQGIVQGTIFARLLSRIGETRLKVGNEALYVRPSIPSGDPNVDGISPPLVHRVVVPAHEEMTVQVIHWGTESTYYSNKKEWGNLAVHISAC
jgi:lysophospholipase L1-like esterase